MLTTEELRETIVKALGIGVCTAQPCAHASCHFNLDGLAAIAALAQRTRDLAGEKHELLLLLDELQCTLPECRCGSCCVCKTRAVLTQPEAPTPEPDEAGDEEILDWVATRWWLDIGTQNTKWREFDPSDSSETNDLRGDIIAAMRADDA